MESAVWHDGTTFDLDKKGQKGTINVEINTDVKVA